MPRATIKETTLIKDTMGNMNRQKDNAGYRLKKVKAPITNRQMCNTDYTGNAEGQNNGGYKCPKKDKACATPFISETTGPGCPASSGSSGYRW